MIQLVLSWVCKDECDLVDKKVVRVDVSPESREAWQQALDRLCGGVVLVIVKEHSDSFQCNISGGQYDGWSTSVVKEQILDGTAFEAFKQHNPSYR
jgi:hypothetical protein